MGAIDQFGPQGFDWQDLYRRLLVKYINCWPHDLRLFFKKSHYGSYMLPWQQFQYNQLKTLMQPLPLPNDAFHEI